MFDFVFPATFTLLFCAGLVRAIRHRNGDASLSEAALIVGTTVCGVLMVVTVAITVWWYFFFSMPNF